MLKFIKSSIVILSLLILANLINAQSIPHNFRFYNSNQGFHFDRVNEMLQDDFGFLWIATKEGLARYDGAKFQTFEHVASAKYLQGNVVCILKDRRNDLWFGTNNGLVFYSNQTGIFENISLEKSQKAYTFCLTEDANGKIWVCSERGIFVIENFQKRSQPVKIASFFNAYVHSNGGSNVFISTNNKIYKYDIVNSKLLDSVSYTSNKNESNNIQTTTKMDANGNIWIGKYNGEIFKVDSKLWNVTLFDMKKVTGVPSSLISNLYLDNEKNLWVAVDEGGIWKFDYTKQKFLPYITNTLTNNSLPSYKFTTLFIDRDKNFWFGMSKNGLGFTNSQMNLFNRLDLIDFSYNTINSAIFKDKNGSIWIGTDGAGLLHFNYKFKLLKAYKQQYGNKSSISNDAIMHIMHDSKDRIWIGSFRGGLSLYNPKTNTFKHYMHDENNPNSIPNNDVRKIAEDKVGNLWLAAHGKAISCFNPEKQTFTNYTSISNPWFYDLIVDNEGAVWVSSVKGVSRKKISDVNFVEIPLANIADDNLQNDFTCLFQDRKGTIWIGSVHGLLRYSKSKNAVEKSKLNGLLDKSSVKAIAEDKIGNLYISTNRGIFRYDPKNERCMHFGTENGLISEDFIINSTFGSSDSLLYFGTSKGLCWFNSNKVKELDSLPRPVISDIKVFGESIMPWSNNPKIDFQFSFLKQIELSYDQNNLSLDFACPFYNDGTFGIRFQYQLEGIEKNWQWISPNNTATYSSLPPGKYELKVRALNGKSESLYSKEQMLSIIIKPPFWETWWFRFFTLVLIISGFVFYYRYKTKQLMLANKILEEKIAARTYEISQKNNRLEVQRAELELANVSKDKLFSIIGHDLRSPFSAVLALGEMLQKSNPSSMTIKEKEITKHIVKASKNAYHLLENILHWARTQTGRISFQPSDVDIQILVQEVMDSVSFQAKEKKITLEKEIEQNISARVDKDMLETMLRNLLNNAIKFTKPDGTIIVKVKTNESGFDLHIKDNGVGISEDQKNRILNEGKNKSTYGTRGEAGTGLGLLVCREFLEFHMGTWEIVSQQGFGTEFIIHLPCEFKMINASLSTLVPQTNDNNIENEVTIISDKSVLLNKHELEIIKGKKILIVDDLEEIRKSIIYQLNDIFLLAEASNGIEAFQMAKEFMPDLILSDVVMPEMNGLDLSIKLKQDISTSHIPIILLTSQKEELDVISGLQSGVDDYLLKPFVPNILFLKITKLLINRENLKKKFSLDDSSLLESIAENSHDQILLKKVFKVIDEHLSDEEFGVEALSQEIGMHRSNFSRKITSLTGISPQDLIKTRRMKHAAKLLLASGKNISEVAYETGFSDPKYFSRVFKSYFGVLPSEYLN